MDLHVRVQADRFVVWALIGLLIFVTFVLFLAGFQQVGSEAAGLILAGFFLAAMTVRVARYYLLPQLSVTQAEVIVRRFWRPTLKWPFQGTMAWNRQPQRIEHGWRGRRLARPITVERLFRIAHDGSQAEIVLPGFAGHNEPVLVAIAERSGIDVTIRPD